MLKHFLTIIITLSVATSFAQDAVFSQFYASPLYLNPAMAGTGYGPRINLAYRNQWPAISDGMTAGYVTYMAGYDQHIDAISGGIGAYLYADQVADGILKDVTAAIMYSAQIKLSRKFAMKMGIQGSFTNRQLDWDRLTFTDQIDPVSGFFDEFGVPNPTNEPRPADLGISFFDMAAGLLFFSPRSYGGVAVHHLLQPSETFQADDQSKRKMRLTAHGGTVIYTNEQYNVFLSPNILYSYQDRFHQLAGGMYFNYQFLYGGLWYRHTFGNSDAVIVQAGVNKGIIRFGYSYDITLSRLAGNSGGAHELSLTIRPKGSDNSIMPNNQAGLLECPAILGF